MERKKQKQTQEITQIEQRQLKVATKNHLVEIKSTMYLFKKQFLIALIYSKVKEAKYHCKNRQSLNRQFRIYLKLSIDSEIKSTNSLKELFSQKPYNFEHHTMQINPFIQSSLPLTFFHEKLVMLKQKIMPTRE